MRNLESRMPSALDDLLLPAIAERALLAANHVLGAHPVAADRLKPHAGKRLEVCVVKLVGPLPLPRPVRLAITAAGLLEADSGAAADDTTTPDLRLAIDLSHPLKALDSLGAGKMPPVDVQGDAALAAEVSWVLTNVRWDAMGDVQRLFGPVLAEGVQRGSDAASAAAHAVLDGLRTLGERLRRP
jgi:ubiquinone biosynthesis accessory factor UbiJ